MKTNIYKLLSADKRSLLSFSLFFISLTAYSQATYTFSHTGGQQTVALQAGSYSVQCWGAKGESAVNQPTGGVGGFSTGTFSLSSTTTVYVSVGGKGSLSPSSAAFANGGYNGGGQGYGSTVVGAGGGGASHLATATGVLSALASNTAAIIIVAGGGGGSGYAGVGGNGGGVIGGNGNSGTGGNIGSTFGSGANGTTAGTCGGGGGGWYGGNLGSPGNTGGAGGGSGYIGGVTGGLTVQFGQAGFIPDPDVVGHGLVVITELCSISIFSSGTSTANSSICTGQSLTLTTNAVSNYSWSTGQTTSSIVVAPTTNTVYSLAATSSLNCNSSATRSVVVSSGLPVLSIANPSSNICLGQTVSLTATGALTYTWTNAGVVNGQSFTPSGTAAYTVTGQNGCGTSIATTTVTVAPLSVSATASPTLVCEGYTTSLTGLSAVSGYTWMPGSQTGSMITVAPTANTIYTVTASNGICAGTQTVLITTKTTPVIATSQTLANICMGQSLTLSASGAGAGGSYSWSPGGAGTSIVLAPSTSTSVLVAGTNSLNCTSTAQQIILVGQPPALNVTTNKTAACAGDPVILTASGAPIYQWANGPTTANYTVNPTSTTVYTVTGSHNTNTCTAIATITITAIIPNVTVTSSLTVCDGGSVAIVATGATLYKWNAGINSSNNTFITTPIASSIFTLVATTTSFNVNCLSTFYTSVTVNANPSVSVTPGKQTICKGETHTLTATGASSYSWSAPAATGSVITVKPNTTTIYTVTGVDANGCENTILYSAKVSGCNGLNELSNQLGLSVYPNPNNGKFFVSAESPVTLTLINTLGQIIETIELNNENGFRGEVTGLAKGIFYLTSANTAQHLAYKLIVN